MKGVLDSIELRMLRRADYLPTQLPTHLLVLTAFRSCEHVTLEGCCALSYSLLSLAFATRWNPKHPLYISTRLFCKHNETNQAFKKIYACYQFRFIKKDWKVQNLSISAATPEFYMSHNH